MATTPTKSLMSNKAVMAAAGAGLLILGITIGGISVFAFTKFKSNQSNMPLEQPKPQAEQPAPAQETQKKPQRKQQHKKEEKEDVNADDSI